ncbi:MAG: TetR/AcrR family transcriptional regulator [Bacteroidota bacterium]
MNIKHSKEAILKIGMELFRTNGYNKTGTNEILKAAGISRGSFYNFFKDKEDFGLQALKYYTDGAVDFMEQILTDQSRSPLKRIRFMFTDFIATYKSLEFKWGCLLAGMSLELGRVNENFEEATLEEYRRYVEVLEKCIKEGQKVGEIRKDYSGKKLAIYTFSSYNGALVMMKAGMGSEPLDNFLKQGLAYLKS